MSRLSQVLSLLLVALVCGPLAKAQAPDTGADPAGDAPEEVTAPPAVDAPSPGIRREEPLPIAEDAPKRPAAPPFLGLRRGDGLMVGLGFGAHGCTDDWCRRLDPMVYLRLSALYRVFRYVAVGLHMSFLFNDAELHPESPEGLKVISWHMIIGPEIRGIFQLGGLDLWSGIVLGYQRSQTDWRLDGESWNTYSHGFGFGWGIGADYFLTPMIALGLNFWLYKPRLTKVCASGDGIEDGCDKVESQDGIGINWTVGASATFWFGK